MGSSYGKFTRRKVLESTLGISVITAMTGFASGSLSDDTASKQGFGPELIEEDEEAGFNFPYYLYAPPQGRDKPIVVESVNSGVPSDDMDDHIDSAESTIERGLSRIISDELGIPFLVPVIKDPRKPGFDNIRTQSLDTETMHIDDGRYERIDKQVVQMVDDARERLEEYGYNLPEEFILNGFSQSGNFANNLALLQPERVTSVTAGGINGLGILPVDEAEGEEVNYQLGTADFELLTGKPFNKEAWKETRQFCYIGANERTPSDDTIPYSDVWGDREQAQRAVEVYGFDMQRERMVYSDLIYHRVDADSKFEVYDNVGHDRSDPDIIRETLGFHARSLEIPYISVVRGLTSESDELELDVFVPAGSTDVQEVRVFKDGEDVSEEPVVIRKGESNRIIVPLSISLGLSDTIEIAVFNKSETELSNALYSDQRQVVFDVSFRSTPEPGDTSIEIEYEADTPIRPSLLTDNGTLYWQRRESLEHLFGERNTEVYEFSRADEGVPFESGDRLELQVSLPDDPRSLRSVVDAVTVGDAESFDPATRAIGEVHHDNVEVSFNSPPTINSTTVDIECSVSEEFDQEVGLDLFPETGTGRWGISSDWDFESGWKYLPSAEPGETVTGEYDVPPITFAPTDTPVLGSSVELRAYPDDWSRLHDFVASTKTVISGIRFADPPEESQDSVLVEYLYPSSYDVDGEVHLVVDGDTVVEHTGIEPGTKHREELSLQGETSFSSLETIPEDAEITVAITPTTGETLDTATRTALPADVADINVTTPPEVGDSSLSLSYRLDSDFETDRVATLRLYTEHTSSWGILLEEVAPGENITDNISINTDEVCVPFGAGTEVSVKLVDWNDPYAACPLAETSVTVGSDSEFSGAIDADTEQLVFEDSQATAKATLSVTESSGQESVTDIHIAVDDLVGTYDTIPSDNITVKLQEFDLEPGQTQHIDIEVDPPEELLSEAYSGDVEITGNNGDVTYQTSISAIVEASHPSGVDREVWDAVTDQNQASSELTYQDLDDAVHAYQHDQEINGTTLDLQDLIDLIQWYHG